MDPNRYKEIERKYYSLEAYVFCKSLFNSLSEEKMRELLAYAHLGKEEFMEKCNIAVKYEIQYPSNPEAKTTIEYFNDTPVVDYAKRIFFIFLKAEEKTEFDELNRAISQYSDEVATSRKQVIRQNLDYVSKDLRDEIIEYLLNTDIEKEITKGINNRSANNTHGKIIYLGIRNHFFTQEEFAEFWKLLVKEIIDPYKTQSR